MLSKYKIHSIVKQGSFGKIFIATHKRNGELVAIKAEKRELNNSLKHEARVYYYLKNIDGVPKILWFGSDEVNSYIMLPVLGSNLNQYKQNVTMTDDIIKNICNSVSSILKDIHTMQIVHGDIKPDNIMFDHKREKIYIIDFGFSRKCTNDPTSSSKSQIGTPNYMSRSCHMALEPMYLDDMESFFFVLNSLYHSYLPWSNETKHSVFKTLKDNFITHISSCNHILSKFASTLLDTTRGEQINYNLFII